jgi:phosphoenolpyruvate carboxykinase (GTP)
MRAKLREVFAAACAAARCTSSPSAWGPLGSPIAKIGVQITDSPYVVVNMRIMTRMGAKVLEVLGDGPFIPCMHSVGAPLAPGQQDVPWPCEPDIAKKYIATSPTPPRSGPTARATAATRCWARSAWPCASPRPWPATRAGWPSTCSSSGSVAPTGEKDLHRRGLPQRLRQDQPRHARPARLGFEGWKVTTVGDDIAWIKKARRQACAPSTPRPASSASRRAPTYTNPNAMARWRELDLHQRRAHRRRRRVVGGHDGEPPAHLIDWQGNDWTPERGRPAAHPNSRFTAPASQCPSIDADWENPRACRSAPSSSAAA